MLIPGLCGPLFPEKKSVLDYYTMLSPEYLNGFKFDFFRKNTAWKARSPATQEEIDPVIDIKNGFISIADPGTGGGTFFQEVALFTARNGAIVIGVTKKLFDGVGFEYDIRFYRLTGNKFVPDDTVLSAPSASMYFTPGTDASIIRKFTMTGYELPRQGTTVRVTIDLIHLGRMNSSEDISDSDRKKYANVLRNRIYDAIEFNWDLKKGRFTMGKKIRKSSAIP